MVIYPPQFEVLFSHFVTNCFRLGAQSRVKNEIAIRQILACYMEEGRHYHTFRHIMECLLHFDRIRHLLSEEDAHVVFFAIVFHDVVYDPRRRDNEEESILYMRRMTHDLQIDPKIILRVEALIGLTHHKDNTPVSPAADHFLDIDLAILGAEPPRYAEYTRQIRAEYAHVSDAQYKLGRRAFLGMMLARAKSGGIYRAEYFRDKHEKMAVENLTRELATLVSRS